MLYLVLKLVHNIWFLLGSLFECLVHIKFKLEQLNWKNKAEKEMK